MGFLSKLLGRSKTNTNQNTNDYYSSEVKRCMIEVKLKKAEYRLLSIAYYRGATSYRTFYENVFMRKADKIMKIIKKANEKSSDGCNIDFTFVRFYKDNRNYIDIPFEDFSMKKDMTLSRRNTKIWNKENLKRILINDPSLRNFDEEMIKEAIKEYLIEIK